MIGISVSFCVKEIASGIVSIDLVEKIVSGMALPPGPQLDEAIEGYSRTYWREYPEEAKKIFYQLLAEGKIEQPRLLNNNHFPMIPSGEYWVRSEDDIIWHDRPKARTN